MTLLRSKLANRILFGIVISSILTFPVFTFYSVKSSHEAINRSFIEKAITVGQVLDANIRNEIKLSDHEKLFDDIQQLIWVNADILSIDVNRSIDGEMITIVSTQPDQVGQQANSRNLRALQTGQIVHEVIQTDRGQYLKLVSPIRQGRIPIGSFEITMTMETVDRDVSEATISIIASYLGLLLVFSLVLVATLRQSVTKPIENLTQMVRSFSAGDRTARASSGGSNELVLLADMLNEIAEAISARDVELAAEREQLLNLNTQLKDNESALVGAISSAETANRAKSEFLAAMSHELRTPLNAIIGFAEVLKMEILGPLNDRQRERADHIHESDVHLLSLINDMLDLSKIEADRFEPHFEKISIGTGLRDAARFVRNKAETAGVELMVGDFGGFPDLYVDQRLFKQIFINLLSNAVTATPEGGRVEISGVQQDNRVRIDVKDNGIGMRQEEIARITEAFVQIDRGKNKPHEGTGLGLYLVEKYLELHNGEIAFNSEQGAGTVVSVWFPVTGMPDQQT